jgi:hypothetical protein
LLAGIRLKSHVSNKLCNKIADSILLNILDSLLCPRWREAAQFCGILFVCVQTEFVLEMGLRGGIRGAYKQLLPCI